MIVLGFDIGGTKSAVILAEEINGEILFHDRVEIKTTVNWESVIDELIDIGKKMLNQINVHYDNFKIGISCGGPLDSGRGVILSPPNLPGWDQVPVVSYLEQSLGMVAGLKNDADACALAEWRYGAGRGCRHMIFLTFGTGLGAGLVLNGRLYEGACGMAGEAGHVRLAEEGPVGYEKAGSFEGFCSGGGIARLARSMAEDALKAGRPVSYMKEGGLDVITARDVAEAAEMGCADAREVLAVSGRYFGRGLAMLVDILNPERIVAGGIYARAGRFLKDEMEKELRREALPASVMPAASCPVAWESRLVIMGL